MTPSPYYTTIDGLGSHELRVDPAAAAAASVYPDLGHASTEEMYALADDALQQAHQQGRSQFAGLIQAATVAAGREEDGQIDELNNDAVLRRELRRETRKLNAQSNADFAALELMNGGANGKPNDSRKRKREQEENAQPQTPTSASALFRQLSTTSKKYTRPPMSKLFTSLELSPEYFLQLQAAAKAFMLSELHPDRRDTVGQRGKGDSELVKLRLWNCVKDFLDGQGNGERFFGPHVVGDEGAQRTMFWPGDKNKIISAITPLLRRIITNERQRQYAVETRKGGGEISTKKRKLNNEEDHDMDLTQDQPPCTLFSDLIGAPLEDYDAWKSYDTEPMITKLREMGGENNISDLQLHNIVAGIDHHLRVFHSKNSNSPKCSAMCEKELIQRILDTGIFDHGNWLYDTVLPETRESARESLMEIFHAIKANIASSGNTAHGHTRSNDTTSIPPSTNVVHSPPSSAFSLAEPLSADQPLLHISLLQNSKRIGVSQDIRTEACPYLHSIVQRALTHYGPTDTAHLKVKVLLPTGLKLISSDEAWKDSIEIAMKTEWMDKLFVLVEL